ncbi:FUSC family protein [Halomonas denitrificans]|nr:FUSC family protein [Halomonas denitrificans]
MFSAATRDSIKFALAATSAILLALSFGWDKPYWAAVVVIVLATTESQSQALYKGWNRMAGTLAGIGIAFLLVDQLGQEPLLFLTVLTLLSGVLVYLAGCPNYGYAFQMTLVLTTLVAAMGQFDDALTFHMAITRLEENILGIVMFSLVYALLWPESASQRFFRQIESVADALQRQVCNLRQNQQVDINSLHRVEASLKPLTAQLSLPLGTSYALKYRPQHWQQSVTALLAMTKALMAPALSVTPTEQETATLDKMDNTLVRLKAIARARGIPEAVPAPTPDELPVPATPLTPLAEANRSLQLACRETDIAMGLAPSDQQRSRPAWPRINLKVNAAQRLHQAVTMMAIMVVAMGLWTWLPVPGGSLFPILVISLGSVLVTFPLKMNNVAFWGVTLFAIPALLQFVFLLPGLTEAWQLGGFYFTNLFLVWRLFPGPKGLLLRLLGAQLMIIMTMGAMQLTPRYDVTQSLTMMVLVWLVILVVRIVMQLLPPPVSSKS